jgi:hypothetical protein
MFFWENAPLLVIPRRIRLILQKILYVRGANCERQTRKPANGGIIGERARLAGWVRRLAEHIFSEQFFAVE